MVPVENARASCIKEKKSYMLEAIMAFSTLGLALLTLFLVGITFWVGSRQTKATRDVAALQMLMLVDERYEKLLDTRKFLSASIIDENRDPYSPLRFAEENEAEKLLDFFEMLGHLVRRDLVDRKLAQNNFSIAVLCYWTGLEPFVSKIRNKYNNDPTIYEEAKWLYDFMLRKEHQRDPNYKISQSFLKNFLQSENG